MEDVIIELKSMKQEVGNHCSPLEESSINVSYYGGDTISIKVGFVEHHIDKTQFYEALKMLKQLQIENTKVKNLEAKNFELRKEINKLKNHDT